MRVLFVSLIACSLHAQTLSILRPYQAPEAPPLRLSNSSRLSTVIRAGQLYLTLQDALALAIENNLGLESDRYGPLLAETALQRAQAGGAIRGVPSASAQVSSVNSGVGVGGSIASAGLGGGGGNGGGGNSGSVAVQQIGQVTPNLDPVLQNSTTFSHLTQPQANTVLSQTSALVQDSRTYDTTYQQGLLTGGSIQLRAYSQYLRENAPSDALNPAYGPHADITLRHNLLRGFGLKLNSRSIKIADLGIVAAGETFRTQLIDLVVSVTGLYWDLVTANDVIKARQAAVDIAQKFHQDTQDRIAIGALARIELPRAAAELANRKQDLLLAQTNVRQLENRLKEAIARTEDPALEAAGIIVLDRIAVPDSDNLPPLHDLVASAMKKRPDLVIAKIRTQSDELNALGTTNPLLPSLGVTARAFNRGVAGTPQASGGAVNPYFIGGNGTAIGQILRRNFPNESVSVSLSAPLGNRLAQADYGIDQLKLRQSTVQSQRAVNQIAVDVSNQVIALRQARARYSTAVRTRELQQQLLTAEQEKFAFGKTSITGLITTQRALVSAQTAEIAALATYARARVSLDQVLGDTLEANHISATEALGTEASGGKL
jgi:outer membrane protein